MDTIRSVTVSPQVTASDPPVRIAHDHADRDGGRTLDPAVHLDLSIDGNRRPETERRGFERDSDSQSVVYRVTDTVSGDVIVQIPNEVIIKARVYGREQNPPTSGARVARYA